MKNDWKQAQICFRDSVLYGLEIALRNQPKGIKRNKSVKPTTRKSGYRLLAEKLAKIEEKEKQSM